MMSSASGEQTPVRVRNPVYWGIVRRLLPTVFFLSSAIYVIWTYVTGYRGALLNPGYQLMTLEFLGGAALAVAIVFLYAIPVLGFKIGETAPREIQIDRDHLVLYWNAVDDLIPTPGEGRVVHFESIHSLEVGNRPTYCVATLRSSNGRPGESPATRLYFAPEVARKIRSAVHEWQRSGVV